MSLFLMQSKFNTGSRALFFISSLILFAACGSKQSPPSPADSRALTDHQSQVPPTGELSKFLFELQGSEWIEECDKTYKTQAQEITAALDARAKEIIQYSSKIPDDDTYKTVPFGNSTVREYTQEPTLLGEWKIEQSVNWADAYDRYQKIKDLPLNSKTGSHWAYLNTYIRFLLSNDESRILDGMNMDLDHTSGEKINSLLQSVGECLKNSDCKMSKFSDSGLEFIKTVGFYHYFYKKLTKPDASLADAREVTLRFQKRLSNDYKRYQFRVNESITSNQVSATQKIITLPLDGSIFDDQQREQLRGYIESIWKTTDLALKIKWSEPLASIFKIFFDLNKPGERSYVAFLDKEVHLFPLVRNRSVAHEIGHVIGFKDRYFTQWDSTKCIYQDESNISDLMSDPAGVVTADEWEEIRKHY